MDSVLTIAGSDSSGGAGIQQDLKVFSRFRLHGASVITAITAQNTQGVQKVHPLPENIISAQLDSVLSDLKPAAIKTGMLFSSGIISVVREKLMDYRNLVVDPVMVSTSGDRLLDENAIEELKGLISIAKLSTPNIHEAGILSGIEIKSIEDMENAAMKIGNCVVKGGHLNYTDILHWNGEIFHFPARDVVRAKIHGTGCAFSAAIAAGIAKDLDVPDSVERAKEFITSAIGRNFQPGSGLRFADTGGIKLSRTVEGEEENKLLSILGDAVGRFVSNPDSYKVMPEVGINIAMALPNAKRLDRVAGITGRVVKDNDQAVPVGFIDFGGTSHIGRVVLTAMKFDAEKRAAMNIKFS
ncbi:MAG: bifunctional hydroxymethylpyrimidine kinase/phosphomethylpyrimidine kinase, partial [Candidatus Altiarchaeota archaeon]|nr:bifunctional hydroxymethylpyrimidine kinase/phosphomethylpyrimidine kinase [Candidatus Altiarchaeota archaeon]